MTPIFQILFKHRFRLIQIRNMPNISNWKIKKLFIHFEISKFVLLIYFNRRFFLNKRFVRFTIECLVSLEDIELTNNRARKACSSSSLFASGIFSLPFLRSFFIIKIVLCGWFAFFTKRFYIRFYVKKAPKFIFSIFILHNVFFDNDRKVPLCLFLIFVRFFVWFM